MGTKYTVTVLYRDGGPGKPKEYDYSIVPEELGIGFKSTQVNTGPPVNFLRKGPGRLLLQPPNCTVSEHIQSS